MNIFAIAVLVLGAANLSLLLLVVQRRVALAGRESRRETSARTLRPAILAFLDTAEPLPSGLGRREHAVLADLLTDYAQLLRGPAHARIIEYFEREGFVARELTALGGARKGSRRAIAAHRLGDIASAAAVPALIAALSDPERIVRTAATRSLGRLRGPDGVEPIVAALVDDSVPGVLARWALLQIGADALPSLRLLLESAVPAQRAIAVELLGLLGGASDATAAEARLRDSSAVVREQAALALGRLGSEQDVPKLVLALEDRIPKVRVAVATSLGRLRDPRATTALIEHACNDQFDVARAAGYALVLVAPTVAKEQATRTAAPHLVEAVQVAHLT